MPENWREEVEDVRTGISLGDLEDGESMEVTFLDEGHFDDTRHGKALVLGVRVDAFPEGYEDMNDEAVEEGAEYSLYSSSSRFQNAVKEFAETLSGASAEIEAIGDSNDFGRSYTVTTA